MLTKLWNILRGYVIINILGFSVEKVINEATKNGLTLWNVRRDNRGFALNISIADFKRIVPLAKNFGCKVKIIDRAGLPFILYKHRKRKALGIGLVLAVFGIYALSSFIWLIEIEGNNRVNTGYIIDFLKENGMYVGALRRNNQNILEHLLINNFEDISWVNISVVGTRVQVELTETIEEAPSIDFSVPADIVAAKDGIILSIATAAGTPKVRPGDVVARGDVLVSSRLNLALVDEEPEYYYVRAISEVWARMHYSMQFEVPLLFYEKSFTGRSKTVYNIIINDVELPISFRRNIFENYEVVRNETRLSFGVNYPMPLVLVTEEHREYTMVTMERSLDGAMFFGNSMIDSYILEHFDPAVQILSQEIFFAEGLQVLEVEVVLVTVERIDEVYMLDFESDVNISS